MEPSQRTAAARTPVALFAALIFGLTQVVLPLLLLGRPRPAPFGWQMYSAAPPVVELTLVLEGGELRPVAKAAWVARERHELDLAELLPPHLCRAMEGVRAVLVHRPGHGDRRFECSP